MTRIFLETTELDLSEELTNQITYAIDDLQNLDSKTTPFTKTIIIPGTARNNEALGNIFNINSSNYTVDDSPNVGYNFNAAKSAKCRIEVNGLQIIKGVFRLLKVIIDGKFIEYEAAVFGELGGFVAKLATKKLEDLDFSAYDHTYDITGITGTWNSANAGEGYYYPLIDYGGVSTGAYGTFKRDYQYGAFRPAFFLKEMVDKIITDNGYTWESTFFNTDFFKRLIIPNNQRGLLKYSATRYVDGSNLSSQPFSGFFTTANIVFPTNTLANFTTADNITFTHSGGTTITTKIVVRLIGTYSNPSASNLRIRIVTTQGNAEYSFPVGTSGSFDQELEFNGPIGPGETVKVILKAQGNPPKSCTVTSATLAVDKEPPGAVELLLGDTVIMNDILPRGILQKDFFASILKMFYLLVTEDKDKTKHLKIEPWVDFFDTSSYLDWSDKLNRGQPIQVTPMSENNARYYQLKFKTDVDFYNEGYRKKYTVSYGDRIYDTVYDFAKETETVEVIFSPTVLVGAPGEDKVVSAIYKKNNALEEIIEHNIRILQAKKVTGVTSWKIMNGATTLSTQTEYPYAGHLDDPDAPNADINFGATNELYFTLVSGDLSNNLFNAYYSSYLAEITDKDSRLLSGYFKLTQQDIYDLNFAKFIYIDGSLFRISKVIDYNTSGEDLTRVELLKVLYTTY